MVGNFSIIVVFLVCVRGLGSDFFFKVELIEYLMVFSVVRFRDMIKIWGLN